MAERLPAEALLIARLHVESLVAKSRWDEAAEIGVRVLRLAEGVPTHDSHANSERVRLVCILGRLGLVGGIDVHTDLVPLLKTSSCLDRAVIADAGKNILARKPPVTRPSVSTSRCSRAPFGSP